jgi:two-component system, cell cycle response regulator DivK
MSQLHALIIDDNPKNISVLANMLSDEKMTHTRVTNCRHLDALVATINHIDVVFLDLEMPGFSGYDILKQLKANPRFAKTPIVAYTVHTSEVQKARQSGFDSFLGKPINADKFPEHLARILRGERIWEAAY